MANMPGQNEQPKPASGGGEKQPDDQKQGKLHESTKHQFPTGHQSPGTPPGTTTYETPEPKRREAGAGQEPSSNPKRAPEHSPGYKDRQEGDYKDEQDRNTRVMQGGRSQADVGDEELDAKDDEKTLHNQKGQRARTAHRKTEVRRGKVNVNVKPKVKARKHK